MSSSIILFPVKKRHKDNVQISTIIFTS